MGHAGAIISGGQGTAAEKYKAMRAAGIRTVQSPAEIGHTMAAALGKPRSVKKKGASGGKVAKRQRGREAKK
jgi:hypothetical protein